MFELKRAERLKEQVKIGEDIIEVNLDLSAVCGEFLKRQNAIIAAETALKENQGEAAIETYGNAVIEILKLIFGEGGAAVILAFYENNYIEMTTEVFPFILDVVVPAINKATESERKKMSALYKSGKK